MFLSIFAYMKAKEFKIQIRKKMEDKGITPYRIFKETGVSQSSLSRWFNDEIDISYTKYYLITEYIGIKRKL